MNTIENGSPLVSDELKAIRERFDDRMRWATEPLPLIAQDFATLLPLAERAAELEARVKELEAALKPFADFASKAEQFVAGTATFGGSPIMPTKHFRLSDFERARTALGDEQ